MKRKGGGIGWDDGAERGGEGRGGAEEGRGKEGGDGEEEDRRREGV